MANSRITQIEFAPRVPFDGKRVAAYARVSSGKDAMLQSLASQVCYYSDLIQKHCGWEYVGSRCGAVNTRAAAPRPGGISTRSVVGRRAGRPATPRPQG